MNSWALDRRCIIGQFQSVRLTVLGERRLLLLLPSRHRWVITSVSYVIRLVVWSDRAYRNTFRWITGCLCYCIVGVTFENSNSVVLAFSSVSCPLPFGGRVGFAVSSCERRPFNVFGRCPSLAPLCHRLLPKVALFGSASSLRYI